MTDKILYWATTVSSGIALILLITNLTMINGNQALQGDINQKQIVINTASTVLPLNQQLSNALYDVSVKTNDENIRSLLTAQGFTLPTKAEKDSAPKVAQDANKAAAPKKTIKKSEEE